MRGKMRATWQSSARGPPGANAPANSGITKPKFTKFLSDRTGIIGGVIAHIHGEILPSVEEFQRTE